MRHAQFETVRGTGRFRIRAKNGRIVGPTEAFKGGPSKVARGIAAMLRACREARKYPVKVVDQ